MSEEIGSIPVLNAKDAIAGHVRWKIRLQLAIRMRESLSEGMVRAIRNPGECSIGRWMQSPETVELRVFPEFATLVARHEEFHRQMLLVAELIGEGAFDEAERALLPGSGFRRASQAIAEAISAVDRIHTIGG